MMIDEKARFEWYRIGIIVFVVFFFGCSPVAGPKSDPVPDPVKSSSKSDVLASMGEPDQIQDLIVSKNSGLFGPQERFLRYLPDGTVIEQWRYEIGDEIVIVLFSGEIADARENWLVLGAIRFSVDVVF